MICVSSISYVLGESRPITSIPELRDDAIGTKYLIDRGFRFYRHSDVEPWQLGVEAARKTLEMSQLFPSDIDHVVYASISSSPIIGDRGIGLFANHMSMLGTSITGICFGECTNAMLGL